MSKEDALETKLFDARTRLAGKYGYVQSWRSVSDRSTLFICGNVVVRLLDDDLDKATDLFLLVDALVKLKLCATELGRLAARPVDPLDVSYDGLALRLLITIDAIGQREGLLPDRKPLTPDQRAAVSAYWSAQLRAKVDATKQAERTQVVCDWQDEP